MTVDEIAEYYSNLLIIQYNKKPKATDTIKAIVKPLLMDKLPLFIEGGYDVKNAVGHQLDVLGKYAGIKRVNFNNNGDVVRLNDSDYSSLLLFSIISNHSTASFRDIKENLFMVFGNDVQVFDLGNMRMSYTIRVGVGSDELIDVLTSQNLLPKPMGVSLSNTIYVPTRNRFFGFQSYTQRNQSRGFNSYSNYNRDSTWLSYDFAL